MVTQNYWAVLCLLPSKQDIILLATELKTAWRQDLQTVQTDVTTLQARMQTLEDSQASLKSLVSSIQSAL